VWNVFQICNFFCSGGALVAVRKFAVLIPERTHVKRAPTRGEPRAGAERK